MKTKEYQLNEVSISSNNFGVFKSIYVKVLGNIYHIFQSSGKYNYVSVVKKTNNPFGGMIGKDFANFDEAAKNYKSADMKVALLMAENSFKNS